MTVNDSKQLTKLTAAERRAVWAIVTKEEQFAYIKETLSATISLKSLLEAVREDIQ